MHIVTLVITSCTSRKRKLIADDLHMGALPSAHLTELAADWAARLKATEPRYRALDVYRGRGFREAVLSAEALDAHLMVVSAGLGLIDGSTLIPPYGCTILTGADDSIDSRAAGSFGVAEWWALVTDLSPFAVALQDVVGEIGGLILLALS